MICTLCPRNCKAERAEETGAGVCRMGTMPRIARAALHMWEEPCISGTRGSGAVFFSGCGLRCVFCQNERISQKGEGKQVTPKRLSEIFRELEEQGAHNINLVTAAHFVPTVLDALALYRPNLPIVYNSSGYESVETLRMLDGAVDIYLPDYKYIDPNMAAMLSGARDYPDVAHAAIAEMVRQFPAERHVIIEDTREIQCAAENVVPMHTTIEVTMTKCLKQTLRFRPTRIHVGEVRDEAALDLLDAWNTGHSGGVSTIHANSARQGLSRLRGLVSRSPHAPHCIEEVIGEAVQLIVFMERTQAGRRVKEMLAVDGYSTGTHEYAVRDLLQ